LTRVVGVKMVKASVSTRPDKSSKASSRSKALGAIVPSIAKGGASKSTKPKKPNARVERALKKKAPQLVEFTRRALFMRGNSTSQSIVNVLRDLALMTKPNNRTLTRKNEIYPFEDANSLEFLCEKNDCSLFVLGSHTKKRPNNLVMGRTFDGHILDMFEFGVDAFESMQDFVSPKKAIGSKPLMLFLGDQWDTDANFGKIQNFLLDFFRADKIDKIALRGMDHVISCTASDGKIYIRVYSLSFQKSGSRVPKTHLEAMGPFMEMSVRRTQFASEDLWKTACKKPASIKPAKVKNVSETVLGAKVGKIHMKKQNFAKMGGRRNTALRDGKRNITDTSGGRARPKDPDF